MAYFWTKSKYRKTHLILFAISILGLVPIVFFINLLNYYFGDSIVAISISLFIVFFWIGLPINLDIYLTGESVTRYGLWIQRNKKGKGTIGKVIFETAKSSGIGAVVLSLILKFIIAYR